MPLSMSSFDERNYSNTHMYSWNGGKCTLSFRSESSTAANDPMFVGEALIEFFTVDKFQHVRASTATSPVVVEEREWGDSFRRKWQGDLKTLFQLEISEHWLGLCSVIRKTAVFAPAAACDFLCNVALMECNEAIRKAEFLGHKTLWMLVDVTVYTRRTFDSEVPPPLPPPPQRLVAEDSEDEYDDESDDDRYYEGEYTDVSDDEDEVNRQSVAPMSAIRQHVKFMDVYEGDIQMCSICHGNVKVGKPAGKMPCSHMFHQHCLMRWLGKSNACPYCRREIPEPEGINLL